MRSKIWGNLSRFTLKSGVNPLFYFLNWYRKERLQVAIVIASLIYLIFETSFHALLTMTVINPESNISDIHRVEIYGRLISGFGSGLLVVSFFKNWFRTSRLYVIFGIFFVAYCGVYFGQKAFIEEYFIKPSSPEIRRDAVLVNTVKVGFYNRDLKHENIHISDAVQKSIESKVMLSLISAGFLYNDSFKNSVMSQLDGILESIAWNAFDKNYDSDFWPKFKDSKDEVSEAFNEYARAHKERDRELTKASLTRRWNDAYDNAALEYIREDIREQVKKKGYSLRNSRVQRWYNDNVSRSYYEVVSYKKDSRAKLTRGSAKRFIRKAKDPNSKINKELRKELDIPKGGYFVLYPKNPSINWFANKIIIEFERELEKKLLEYDIKNMKANIRSFSMFEKHSDIRSKAKESLGDYYTKGFSFNWSYKDFFESSRPVFIRKEVNRMKHEITSSTDGFVEGGKFEEKGKNALRSILIPCIALVLSVLLSVFTAVKLLYMLIVGAYKAFTTKVQVDKQQLLYYDTKTSDKKLISISVFVFILLFVLFTPSIFGVSNEVKVLLSQNSPIKVSFISSLDELSTYIFDDIIYGEIILGSLGFIFLSCIFYKLMIRFDKSRTKVIYVFSLSVLLITTSFSSLDKAGLPIMDSRSEVVYKWLLTVQPVVFEQGLVVNDTVKLPLVVSWLTKPLKNIDSHFWPEK